MATEIRTMLVALTTGDFLEVRVNGQTVALAGNGSERLIIAEPTKLELVSEHGTIGWEQS